VRVVEIRIELAGNPLARNLHLVGDLVLPHNRFRGQRACLWQSRIDHTPVGEADVDKSLGNEAQISRETQVRCDALRRQQPRYRHRQ
jgi:hypothetical protein